MAAAGRLTARRPHMVSSWVAFLTALRGSFEAELEAREGVGEAVEAEAETKRAGGGSVRNIYFCQL